MKGFFTVLGSIFLVSCVEAPQHEIELELIARGKEVDAVQLSSDLSVSVSRADVALGPLYLCPATQAGDLCETARLEWLGSEVFDAIDPGEQTLGLLSGVTGGVRSWMFDYGISSRLTSEQPHVSEAAQELGGVSLHMEGVAQVFGAPVAFALEVRVASESGAGRGLPIVRKSATDTFEHEVSQNDTALVIDFDPQAWLVHLRPSDFCPDPASCPEQVTFAQTSRVATQVSQAMVTGEHPLFSFREQ